MRSSVLIPSTGAMLQGVWHRFPVLSSCTHETPSCSPPLSRLFVAQDYGASVLLLDRTQSA